MHGVIRDVTERWEVQKKIDDERAFTQAVLDSMPAVFYVIDRNGIFVRWNRKLLDLSGLTADSIRNASLLDMMNESQPRPVQEKSR